MAKKFILVAIIAIAALKFAGIHPLTLAHDFESYSDRSAGAMMGGSLTGS